MFPPKNLARKGLMDVEFPFTKLTEEIHTACEALARHCRWTKFLLVNEIITDNTRADRKSHKTWGKDSTWCVIRRTQFQMRF